MIQFCCIFIFEGGIDVKTIGSTIKKGLIRDD